MLGYFSFREKSVPEVIDFWMTFLAILNIHVDYVTIHSDKFDEWKPFYSQYQVEIKTDNECLWTDGDIGGYCTEFYSNNVEIGNIVNTLGTCIDVGFGVERLAGMLGYQVPSRDILIKETILKLINSGINIDHNKQGYILKKLMTDFVFSGEVIDHPCFDDIKQRQLQVYEKYLRMSQSKQYKNKTNDWWKSSIGIDLDNIEKYKKLIGE